MKKINKSKTSHVANVKPHGKNKKPVYLIFKKFIKSKPCLLRLIHKKPTKPVLKRYHKNILITMAMIVFVTVLIMITLYPWVINSSLSLSNTYPNATVLGTNLGGLDSNKLNDKIEDLKSEFEKHKITLINDGEQWSFDVGELGVFFDVDATSQNVLNLNKLSLIDKYRLLTGAISSDVQPTLSINNEMCVKSLSVIPETQIKPKNASIYFDQSLKIQPDQPGTKFNAVTTCQNLPSLLQTNSFVTNVSLDITQANITKADFEAQFSKIQYMAGEPLLLKSGSYNLTLTQEQLLALLVISKKESDLTIEWSSSKLDDLVNNVADKINTYNKSPALGSCQYISSTGGYWLDKNATKQYIQNISADSSRDYNLPIVYHGVVIGERKLVSSGSSGTIYLTFDDGMTYADQIMNYAACYGVKVTFFEIGGRVAGDSVQLKRAIAEGHAVQSHGYEHAMYDYGKRSYEWQVNDMSQSISAIMGVTGVRPTYFRPPGGNKSDLTYQAAAANNLTLIMWGDASRDATVGGLSSSATCANVLAGAYNGASVLMHSTNYTTAMAFPCIVEGLAARGYNMQALR